MIDRRRLILALGGTASNHKSRTRTAEQSDEPTRFFASPLGKMPPGTRRHQTLPRVERANDFTIATGERIVLHGVSRASASCWATTLALDPTSRPILRRAWRLQRSLRASDFKNKFADDYVARDYVFFHLPAALLGIGARSLQAAPHLLSPQPLPSASICHVWGSPQQAVGSRGRNPDTDAMRMVEVDSGDTHAGRRRSSHRDLRLVWRHAYGGPVPHINGLAVGLDTDSSQGEVQAWFGDITLEAM